MSREQQDQWRWLGGFRLAVSLTLLFTLMGLLASAYQSHRGAAQVAALTELVGQFGERSQRLHGLWLMGQRPPVLRAEGRLWYFSANGWPNGVDSMAPDPCPALWQALIGSRELDGEPLSLNQRAQGCEIGLGAVRWYYDWRTGAVRQTEGDEVQR